jgi:hypothetical protein
MHLSHSVNLVDSQLQPELGYMHPPFLKYATKVKLSTGAGLLVLVRDDIQNCLYFDCLFAHYVYMSGFYLYII